MTEKLYTPQEIADILKYNVKTIYNYIGEGRINVVKVFGSNRITETELKRLINDK